LVVEQGQAVFQVLLNDLDAALYAGNDVAVVDFHARAADLALIAQISKQGAVTAPQVQHAAAGLDPAGNADQVRTHVLLAHRRKARGAHAGHPSSAGSLAATARPSLCAIRS